MEEEEARLKALVSEMNNFKKLFKFRQVNNITRACYCASQNVLI
jgi:hypothetical protein